MSQNMTETVRLAQSGDHRAIGKLYDRYAPMVRSICFDRCRNEQTAADISQDVFLAVLTDLKSLKDPEKFAPWLAGIARRKAIDSLRLLHRRRNRTSQDLDCQRVAFENERHEKPIESSEIKVLLLETISGLPENERLTIHLFYFEELPVDRIAELMSLSRSTIYATLIEARKKLKHRLKERGCSEVLR